MSKYRRPAHSIVEEPRFFLRHWWHGFVDWLKRHRDQVLTAALALAVLVAAWLLWARHSRTMDVEGWVRFGSPGGLPDLESAALTYGKTTAGPFLRLRLADEYLRTAQSDKAVKAYSQVASAVGLTGMRARYTLAKALEDTDRFEDALEILETLAAEEGFWGEMAQEAVDGQPKRRAAYEQLKQLEELREQARAAAEAESARTAGAGDEIGEAEVEQAAELEGEQARGIAPGRIEELTPAESGHVQPPEPEPGGAEAERDDKQPESPADSPAPQSQAPGEAATAED